MEKVASINILHSTNLPPLFFTFLQTRVISTQNFQYLGSAEFRRHLGAFREHLAQLRAGDLQAVCIIVRAGAPGSHAAAFVAPEGNVDFRSEEHTSELQS